MRTRCSAVALTFLVFGLTSLGCARVLEPTAEGARYRKFTGTSYASNGDEFSLIVDVRASRIAERQEFLPLLVAFLNKSESRVEVFRESFVLETSDGTRLPVVGYGEFENDYARQSVDLRAGEDFVSALNGRYPDPPFRHRALEFYPHRSSGVAPRNDIELGQAEMAIGFLYFRLPNEEVLDDLGNCRMLFTTGDDDTQYVLELQAYRAKKKS
jgi:hypothetical protein